MTSPQNELPIAPPDSPITDQSIPQTPVARVRRGSHFGFGPACRRNVGGVGLVSHSHGYTRGGSLRHAGRCAGRFGDPVWWLLFSRARWFERLGAVALIVLALYVTSKLIDISILNGAMGNLFFVLAVPVLALTLVVWAVATQRLRFTDGVRRASLVLAILLVCGGFMCCALVA